MNGEPVSKHTDVAAMTDDLRGSKPAGQRLHGGAPAAASCPLIRTTDQVGAAVTTIKGRTS